MTEEDKLPTNLEDRVKLAQEIAGEVFEEPEVAEEEEVQAEAPETVEEDPEPSTEDEPELPEEDPDHEEVQQPDPWEDVRSKYTPEQIAEMEQNYNRSQGTLDTFHRIVETQGVDEAVKFMAKFLGSEETAEPEPEDPYSYDEKPAYVKNLEKKQQALEEQLNAQMASIANTTVNREIEAAMGTEEWASLRKAPRLFEVYKKSIYDRVMSDPNSRYDNIPAQVAAAARQERDDWNKTSEALGLQNLQRLGRKKQKAKAGIPPGQGPRGAVRSRPAPESRRVPVGDYGKAKQERLAMGERMLKELYAQE